MKNAMEKPAIKILLVEDDPEDVEFIKALLGDVESPELRFDVERAETFASAVSKARSWRPDVALLDLSLPDVQGMETVSRARVAFADFPFVVLTGFSDEGIGLQAVSEGAQDYLLKDQLQGAMIARAVRYAIERKRASDEAADSSRREAMQREFTANVSHEFRTPLAAIQASLESLERGGIDDLQHRQMFLDAVRRQTKRLSTLVEDLLARASLESESFQPIPQDVDMGAEIKECLELFRPRALDQEVHMSASVERFNVWVDPRQLRQVLHNLVENALKYNRRGGAVRITACSTGNEAQVMVSDTGPGIPKEEIPFLFTPFHRTRAAASSGIAGTGLGLSIAKKAVEVSGGRLWVESELGKGTSFYFVLPLNETAKGKAAMREREVLQDGR